MPCIVGLGLQETERVVYFRKDLLQLTKATPVLGYTFGTCFAFYSPVRLGNSW